MQIVEGMLDASGLRFALVVSRFNQALTTRLEEGAVDCLLRHGADEENITTFRVPGAWEIPMLAGRLARRGEFDAVICLGALVRGGTPHFDLIAAEVAKGIAQIGMSSDVPLVPARKSLCGNGPVLGSDHGVRKHSGAASAG